MIDHFFRSGAALRFGAGLALALFAAGCQTPPQSVTVMPAAATDARLRQEIAPTTVNLEHSEPDYVIGVNDELEVKYADRTELNESLKVRPDGNISLQLIGTVKAEGLTPDQFQAEIQRRLRALSSAGGEKEYVIQPADELEIKFVYRPELNERQQVRPDGKITLPMVNTVVAEGKTPEQLAAELRGQYAKYLRVPDLLVILRDASVPTYRQGGHFVRVGTERLEPTVIVRSYAVAQIFVGGEVVRPGVLNYRRSLTLMQAIIEAGGNKPTAELGSVIVLRRSDAGQPLAIRRDLRADLEVKSTNDIELEPFDVVILPKTASATLAEMLEQSVYNIFPPLKNSAFSFLYQVNDTTTRLLPQ